MHFFRSLALISTAASLAAAHRDISHQHLHHKRQQPAGSVYVSGANGLGDGQIHSRLELNDLAANHPEQYNLLILAMGEWQSRKDNLTSYWAISGIHGVPLQSWDDVGPCDTCGDAPGYCHHVSVLFPSWHRTYMALFEQEFIKVAQDIAGRWTGNDRTVYQNAAATIRFPYLDWAAKPDFASNVLPTLLTSPEVTVDGPNGRQSIANPFYQYEIPDTGAMFYEPFTVWPETLRYPQTDAASATSDEQSAINAFNNIQANMQDSVYQLLTNCKDYDHFSHDGASGSTSCGNSLEGIHNTIHTTAGGPGSPGVSGGHMTFLPLAAFDAFFWVHHANVDRIFALWQTLNPQSYGASQVYEHMTWTVAPGTTLDADSPLTPFRKDANSFWTTNEVHDWANTFKYTYPEFASTDGSQGAIAQLVNALYGSNPSLTASSVSKKVEQGSNDLSVGGSASVTATAKRALRPTPSAGFGVGIGLGGLSVSVGMGPGGISVGMGAGRTSYGLGAGWGANATSTGAYPTGTSSSGSSQYKDNKGGQYEYSCNVRTPRFIYNSSYTVYVFDGQPSTDDTTKWLGDDNCVGSLGIFAGGSMHGDTIVQGAVPLTRHLQDKVKQGSLSSMKGEHVNPYLKQNLGWKIVKQGEEIHPDNIPGYKAAVYSGISQPHGPNSLPQWSAWQPQVEATVGKSGGVQSVEEAHNEWSASSSDNSGYGSDSGSNSGYGSESGAASTVWVTTTASDCEATSMPTYPVSTPAPSYPAQSTPVESSPVQSSSAPGYAPAPYPTGPASSPDSPVGTAAPSGYGTSWVPGSYPSITPYTGDASGRLSGSVLISFASCVLACVLLL